MIWKIIYEDREESGSKNPGGHQIMGNQEKSKIQEGTQEMHVGSIGKIRLEPGNSRSRKTKVGEFGKKQIVIYKPQFLVKKLPEHYHHSQTNIV